MARVPYVQREQLTPEQQPHFDAIAGSRGRVGPNFQTLLNSPEAGGRFAAFGEYVRFHGDVPERLKELAIILVAREWNSAIEWTGHAVLAARAGVSQESIEAIRTRKAPEGLTEQEQAIARFVHQLLRHKEVSDEVFAAAHKLVGTRGVVDLALTCSYYTAVALAQIMLKPDMEPGRVSTL